MADDEVVGVRVHGSASVELTSIIAVDPIYDENGDLDSDETLAQLDSRDALRQELDEMVNKRTLMGSLGDGIPISDHLIGNRVTANETK